MQEPIYVKKCRFGYGVFASRRIRKGEKICIMAGDHVELWNWPKLSDARRSSIDLLQIADKKYICMRKPYVLFNHSCSPNAAIINVNTMVAIKAISKGEEILYDYSTVWDDGFMCKCGNRNCRGYITDFFAMPKAVRQKYLRRGLVNNFIKRNARTRIFKKKIRKN